MQKKVTVLGGGAFGSAFSTLLAENGLVVNLWCYEEETSSTIRDIHMNTKFLPGVHLHENIIPTCSVKEALEKEEWICIAVPVKFLRSVLTLAKPHVNKNHKWVILSKGIEQDTLLLPGDVLDDVLGYEAKKCAVGGPTFAEELAKKMPSGIAVAGETVLAKELASMLKNRYFRPITSDDIIGVQVCSAAKNVLALAVGMAKGEGFEDNTCSLILTLGLAEISELVKHLGGNKETVYGLAGVGDTVLTCMGALGRNLKIGIMIGEGQSMEDIEATGITAEGINTAKSLSKIIEKSGLDLPVCMGVYKVLFEERGFRGILDEIIKL